MTAVAIRSLRAYAPAPLKEAYQRAVQRGAAWLAAATAKDHRGPRASCCSGWLGARGRAAAIRGPRTRSLRDSASDGGWSQLPTLASDAYATGQALTALLESGAMKPGDAVYRKGVRFLLDTQLEDGSWYVRARAIPVQPYFDSEFPHGPDQFISAAATNWATMALAGDAQ